MFLIRRCAAVITSMSTEQKDIAVVRTAVVRMKAAVIQMAAQEAVNNNKTECTGTGPA